MTNQATFPELREASKVSDDLHRVSTICDHHYSLDREAAQLIDAQAAEIERLRDLMRAVLDTRDAEAKAQRAFQNALDNYSGEHRSYGIAHTKAMCAASDAEKAARAALEKTK